MRNLTLEKITGACQGILYGNHEKEEITGVVTDSRQVVPGNLFLAIKGERVDGHQFIPQVFEAGAAAVVCEVAPKNPAGPYILVQNVLKALQDIAAYYRSTLDIPIIGITGSVGKTSTKEYIASVLSQKFCVLKTEGNFNNEIGVPLTLLKIREEHEVAVVEMGINHFGEMKRLGRMAKPNYMVYTNIGDCHLEFLGDRRGVLKAKTEVFEELSDPAVVLVNGDDENLATVQDVRGKEPIRFGLRASNSIYADHIVGKGLFGSDATIHTPQGTLKASIPLPGEHMVRNALAATAVGLELGESLKEITKGIASVKPTGGRSRVIQAKNYCVIDDCYNANPVSTEAAIDLLILAQGRKVAILGDMFELGDTAKQMHARVGHYAALKDLDLLICVGELSKEMAKAAEEVTAEKNHNSSTKVLYYAQRDLLMQDLHNLIAKNDTILVKASHGMQFDAIVSELTK